MTITPLEVEKTSGVSGGSQKSLWPVVMVLAMLFLIATSIAGYFYYQYKHSAEVANAEDLVEQIGQTMLLPEGAPTLATVTDREKLAEQPFFQKSENGDKVLIYTQSGRAILYRPSMKKIVDVTSVNVNPQTAQNTPPTETTTPSIPTVPANPNTEAVSGSASPDTLTVALYNGSGKVGETAVLEKELLGYYPKATVTTKETATSTYDETLVIDLTGKSSALTESLSFAIKGKVGTLPDGEQKPDGADILVIVGKNH
jgi:hypothetical protein